MLPRIYHRHYSRNLKTAVICSLFLFVFLFEFFPDLKPVKQKLTVSPELFTIQDIPVTIQSAPSSGIMGKIPQTPLIKISDLTDKPEILKDAVIIPENKVKGELSIQNQSGKLKSASDLSRMVPRQIKEVLPMKLPEGVNGSIRLSLMIGKDGRVIKYKVISNTTGNSRCLENVITAVNNSKWQAAVKDGQKIEYWIDKIYNFK